MCRLLVSRDVKGRWLLHWCINLLAVFLEENEELHETNLSVIIRATLLRLAVARCQDRGLFRCSSNKTKSVRPDKGIRGQKYFN